ncbi:MAG: 3-isopropylmalate dehydratase small subunit [Blastocatellia bacterium]|nr:3-isopropylmalate dehydratase small subunit [Blastocatellia bacterium]
MRAFTVHSGTTAAIDMANIDTDQIIPKQFLTRIERTGYGEFLFHDWRYRPDGSKIETFILNDPERSGATILITGDNFGCGSSREHAPWSLLDHGFRVVIAPGFADIFYNNSLKNGILPVALPPDIVRIMIGRSIASAAYEVTVNLIDMTVTDDTGIAAVFDVDQFRRHCLINGLDDIGLTLQHEKSIAEYELRERRERGFLTRSMHNSAR